VTSQERDTTWGLVVEGDEIWSDRTKKWYPVLGSVSIKGTSTVKIFAKGVPAIVKPAADPVRVRRGATGKAVDVIALVFSGQFMPDVS
jgi:hypothetical protein